MDQMSSANKKIEGLLKDYDQHKVGSEAEELVAIEEEYKRLFGKNIREGLPGIEEDGEDEEGSYYDEEDDDELEEGNRMYTEYEEEVIVEPLKMEDVEIIGPEEIMKAELPRNDG